MSYTATLCVHNDASTFTKYRQYGAYHYRATLGARAWRKHDPRLAARYQTAVNLLRLKAAETVLDAGSGEGVASVLCCRRGTKAIALELDAEACRLGREIAGKERFAEGQLAFRQDDLYALGLEDQSVDKVISLEVIEHMADVPGYLCELQRVLKRGGRIVLSTPLRRADGVLQDRFHIEEFTHDTLRNAVSPFFRNVELFSCWSGRLQRVYENNRPFPLCGKMFRAVIRLGAYCGFNPFVGPVAPDATSPLILCTAVK